MIDVLGANLIMFASDCPHWRGEWPESTNPLRTRTDISDGARVKIRGFERAAFLCPALERSMARSPGVGLFVVRVALTSLALWVVTQFVHGLSFVGGNTALQRVGIIFVVAMIFSFVNAIIKPIVQILSIPLYILTLGLFHVVVNALMLWITARITQHTTRWGLQIDHFWWTAIWAAIVLSVVSWVLSMLIRGAGCRTRG
ncbi:membrane protein [Mycobacterium lepromatosis]|nr:membrane protein [Mycobacterium lepromatosis]